MGPGPRGWDVLAAIATATALAVTGLNLALTGGAVAPGFLAAQLAAALLCAYGSSRAAAGRRPALAVAGAVLAVLGVLAILSTGLLLLVASVLALVTAARAGPAYVTCPGRAGTGARGRTGHPRHPHDGGVA